MFITTKKTLKILAALVWLIGGAVLMIKGYLLLRNANLIHFNMENISIVLVISFILGQIKSKYIFEKFCINNLNRINLIKEPKIYQFFELRFFFLLALMILAGLTLSILAKENYIFLLSLACVDIALSTALLKSSLTFFKNF